MRSVYVLYTRSELVCINCIRSKLYYLIGSCNLCSNQTTTIMQKSFQLTPDRVVILMNLLDMRLHDQHYYVKDSLAEPTKYMEDLLSLLVDLADIIPDHEHDVFVHLNPTLAAYFSDTDEKPYDRVVRARTALGLLDKVEGVDQLRLFPNGKTADPT
jgi:hypothetical protein